MFDLTNDIRGFKNRGWEELPPNVIEQLSAKDAEEGTFQHATCGGEAYVTFHNPLAAAAFEGS
jgi:hypothetical protein